MVDLVLNFRTAYQEDDRWIVSRSRIATHYLRGWFWIDMPASIPVELIELAAQADNDTLSLLRFLRMFRLLRMLKMLKVVVLVNKITTWIEDRYGVNLQFLRILRMVLSLMYLTHLLGCVWYTVGVASHESWGHQEYWLLAYDDGSALTASAGTRYQYSV